MSIDKRTFVDEVGKVLNMAKANLIKCEYKIGKEVENPSPFDKLMPDGEYVVVTCKNEYRYFLNVTGNSLVAIAEEVFSSMACK